MELVPVKSSSLEAVGYDPKSRDLEVTFHNGGHYRYSNVPPNRHAKLIAARSVGGHFVTHVRDAFAFEKVGG